MSTRLRASLACWDYDRVRALQDGRVRPAGMELTYVELTAGETFFRMVHNQEFDIAEMSLSSYVLSLEHGAPFVAIPVFPSRSFRHNSVYVHADGPVKEPGDLRGATVGVPEYQVTAAVWIRGILEDRHDVPIESVSYRTGGLHAAGRVEKIELDLPPGVDVAPIPAGRTLDEMLVTGEIDALYTPRTPKSFENGNPKVARLFPDPRAAEMDYFAATGIFPIMHTIVLRRDFYERNPWAAVSLYDAFVESKRLVETRLSQAAAPLHMLPWLYDHAEEARRLMGTDFWPYGIEPNRGVLEAFLRYLRAQGLSHRDFNVEELFAPETHAFAVI